MPIKEIEGVIQKRETKVKHEISTYNYIVNGIEFTSLNDYELYTGDLVHIKYDETFYSDRQTNVIIEINKLIEDFKIKEKEIKIENVDFIKSWANIVASEHTLKSLMNDKISLPSDKFSLEFKKRKEYLLRLIQDGSN